MEKITFFLALIACGTQIWGHVIYNKDAKIIPNLTSWSIWGITSLLDTWNYSEMTGDWQKNLLSFTCSLMCLITWIICLFKGRFEKLEMEHFIGFLTCGIALVLWRGFDLIKESNITLQIDNLISFIPILIGVMKNPNKENSRPWIVWTFSYFIGTVVVLLRFRQWEDLLYPAGCAFLHFFVGMLALRKK